MSEITYTADVVVLCNNHILLIQRASEPYAGKWALPGGKQSDYERRYGVFLSHTAIRELHEETGVLAHVAQLCYLGYFDASDRDLRGRYVSTAFLLCLTEQPAVFAGSDAACVQWFPLDDLPELAFDHDEIVRCALDLVENVRLPQ